MSEVLRPLVTPPVTPPGRRMIPLPSRQSLSEILAHLLAVAFTVAVCSLVGLDDGATDVARFELPAPAESPAPLTVRATLPPGYRFRPESERPGGRGLLLDESGRPLAVVTVEALPQGGPDTPQGVRVRP
jgi:hypothetical protein